MHDLKIALVQTDQFWENKTANYQHLEQTHFSVIEPGSCDLILLPEMFNTGFSMNVDEMAESEDSESVKWLIKWAKSLDCQIGASLIIKEGNKYYNRFLFVSKEGVEARYNKRHLFRMASENNYFAQGKEKVIHRIKDWKILMQVCYDLRFPVFSRNQTIGDELAYDVSIYLANWPEKRSDIWTVLLQARAIENQVFCVGVNRVGRDGKKITYSGDSAVINPWGKTEFLATKNTEQVKILTLSRETLTAVRHQFPAYRDAD